MKYTKERPYRVEEDFSVETFGLMGIARNVKTKGGFIELRGNVLTIRTGYAWDGPSGPTWDSPAAMLPSCVHDALYELMRLGFLYRKPSRRRADLLFYQLLRAEGMGRIRAGYYFVAVFFCGGSSASPKSIRQVYDTDLAAVK